MKQAKQTAERHRNEGTTLVGESAYQRVFHFRDYKLTLADLLNTIAENKLFIVGRVIYTDIFNLNHFVSFCYFYDSYSQKFLMYNNYNYAD